MHVAVAAALVLLHGTVTHAGPAAKPAAHLTLVFARTGGGVTRVHTDARGRYAVRLHKGSYTVRVPRILPGAVLLLGPMHVDFVLR